MITRPTPFDPETIPPPPPEVEIPEAERGPCPEYGPQPYSRLTAQRACAFSTAVRFAEYARMYARPSPAQDLCKTHAGRERKGRRYAYNERLTANEQGYNNAIAAAKLKAQEAAIGMLRDWLGMLPDADWIDVANELEAKLTSERIARFP